MNPIHRNTIWTGVVVGALTQISDTIQLVRGRANKRDYRIQTLGNVASSIGLMAGIEYGALIGSAVFPGAGTVTGSIVGGFFGDYLGRHLGHHTGCVIHKEQTVNVSGEQVTVTNNYDVHTSESK